MASTTFTTRALMAALFTLLAWAANPLTTQAQLPDYLPTEGLVGWWPFNGNANDESGNGNDGVVNGATLIEDRDGNPNAAYSFDGVTDNISVPNIAANGNAARSVFAWIKTSSNIGKCIVGMGGMNVNAGQFNLVMGYGPGSTNYPGKIGVMGGNFTSGGNDYYPNSGPSVNDNLWHHVGVTFNGDNVLTIYIDGVLVNSATMSYNTIGQINFFGFNNTNGSQWIGQLDDIAIYNRALTPEEVTALYTGQPVVAPCADPAACNFGQEGECVFAQPNLDCAGNCLNDCNNNGVCDENEVLGCTYTFACNYNPAATTDDGTCTVAQPNYDCAGNCLLDLNNNGLCDLEEVSGCTNIDAINYNAEATLDDGSCMTTCKGDFDNDGLISTPDLLAFLAAFGNQCAGAGCMDPTGCNYDPNATFDLGYCEYPAEFFNCEGAPINDADGDGIPDELEVAGCTDPEAGNYNPDATDDNGSCTFGLTGSTHSCGAENVHNPDLVYGSVTDIDGNTYRTIVIGEQEWMAENLNVSHYANGEPIPNVTNGAQWAGLSTGAWCYYDNDPAYECPYGKLYNWYVTIDERNVCPTGWHVPTFGEWTILTDFLGGDGIAGGKMKTTGTQYWDGPNGGATNVGGFSGLPGGGHRFDGAYLGIGKDGTWWSSSETSPNDAWNRNVFYANGVLSSYFSNKRDGYSVRCLRD